ncbi:MAG: DUF3611 family protein [Cyanobacteria bacterium]|nr:DUF3611 family protein [Cyanobacteriota bacterium]MDW8202555.1 DUF3611 family protein [Cyanobacteriota bacterium SKYGB_h_bin112]
MSKLDSNPPTALQAATAFRFVGWFTFWFQVVLGVVAAITLPFATLFNRSGTPVPGTTNAPVAGIGLGGLFAGIGLLTLMGSIYVAFRYTRLAQQLRASDPAARPKKAETIQVLKLGLTVSLVGMLITLIAALAYIGGLTIKASRTAAPVVTVGAPTQFINTLDILAVQAIAIILLALFAGIVAPLWLLNRITR